MMKKKLLPLVLTVAMTVTLFAGCGKSEKKESETTTNKETSKTTDVTAANTEMNIAMLKGPTAIGFIKAWEDSDEKNASNQYNVTAYGTADEITTGLIKGTIDAAAVPCNLASVLYNKSNGKIKIAAVNTLGVLYVVSTDNSIKSVSDLKGKTIYMTGKGTTPEYSFNYILKQNNLTPGTDVNIEFKSEAAEIASLLNEQDGIVALLPQPYVTTVLMNNDKASIVLDLTEEWNKVSDKTQMITGVVVVNSNFESKNKEAFSNFLKDYKASTEYVNANVEDAAALVEKHDIFKAAVAKTAIPKCNITFIDGNEMKENVSAYLKVLYDADSKSVGGALPGDDFYYINN